MELKCNAMISTEQRMAYLNLGPELEFQFLDMSTKIALVYPKVNFRTKLLEQTLSNNI